MQIPPGGGGGRKNIQKKYKKEKYKKIIKNKNCFVFGIITGPGFFSRDKKT
jgi:hypothetical protein